MEKKYNGKVVEFNFNKVRFIRKLDSYYNAERNGMKFGFGLMLADMHLRQFSVPALAQVLYSACVTKLTMDDVDEIIENEAEETGTLQPLFEEVFEELGKSPIAKATMNELEKLNQKAQKEVPTDEE